MKTYLLGTTGDRILTVPSCHIDMPSVFLAHATALERGTAKYPTRRVVCKSFAIPQNYLDVNHEKLFSGQLPTRIVVGLVDNRAFNGHREQNPFNFQHTHIFTSWT